RTGTYYRLFGLALGIAIGVIIGALILSAVSPFLGLILGMAGYLSLIGYFKAGLANLMISHTTLADHQLTSELDPIRFSWIFLTNNFLTGITLGLYLPWAKVRMA